MSTETQKVEVDSKLMFDLISAHDHLLKILSERIDILNNRLDLSMKYIDDLQSEMSKLSGYIEAVRLMGMK